MNLNNRFLSCVAKEVARQYAWPNWSKKLIQSMK